MHYEQRSSPDGEALGFALTTVCRPRAKAREIIGPLARQRRRLSHPQGGSFYGCASEPLGGSVRAVRRDGTQAGPAMKGRWAGEAFELCAWIGESGSIFFQAHDKESGLRGGICSSPAAAFYSLQEKSFRASRKYPNGAL
jgi:hypothetical protein